MPFILGANETKVTGYDVANSCRFNDGDSAYLSKTYSGSGNKQTQTISVWVKRTTLGNNQSIFSSYASGSSFAFLRIRDDDKLQYYNNSDVELETNRLFRDISAWYHIVVKVDTTQATEGNRVKIYVNGTEETSFATATYPSQNAEVKFADDNLHEIGRHNTSAYFDGYMSEFVFVDGQALTPTSFGEFDEDSPTIWKPIDVSGLSLGTNGFYLDFEDSSDLGADAKGSFDFTANNLAAIDQTTDTCTNNFCTCNPLDQTNTGGSSATMAEGNLKWTSAGNTTSQSYMRATFGLTAGKWYWEAKMSDSNSGVGFNIGVAGSDANMNAGGSGNMPDSDPNTLFKNSASTNSATRKDGSDVTTNLTTVAENQIVQIALDLDNQKFYAGVQGTWLNSADPATGSNAPATVDANTTYLPAWSDNGYTDQITLELNFGNPTFSISSGNADANGYGNFEYAVPSGYYALCTKNLAEFGG